MYPTPSRVRFLLVGLLALLALLPLLGGGARADNAASAPVPPRVMIFAVPDNPAVRELRITVNTDTTALEARHYHADDNPVTDPPRHRCGWGVTGYGSYRGGTVACVHFYADAQPDDVYYIVESGYGPTRTWGPYRLSAAPIPPSGLLLDGPQPATLWLPILGGS